MATPSPACTAACTRKPENEHETTGEADVDEATNDAEPAAGEGADTLAMLAAALVNLSAADRAKLAAILLQGGNADAPAPAAKSGKHKGRSKAKGTSK